MTDRQPSIDALAERYGFPEPVSTGFRPRVAAQIDLSETFERETCCCSLHGSLHNARTCCPVHRQTRAGIAVPAMTPIDDDLAVRDAACPLTPEDIEALNAIEAHPTYDTMLDPCSPDFDLSSWA